MTARTERPSKYTTAADGREESHTGRRANGPGKRAANGPGKLAANGPGKRAANGPGKLAANGPRERAENSPRKRAENSPRKRAPNGPHKSTGHPGRKVVLPLGGVVLAALGGCATYYPVETTPEAITRTVAPGDTVRLRTRDDEAGMQLLVIGVNDYSLHGRIDASEDHEALVSFDRIEDLQVERLNMRKALLRIVLPVVVGAAIVCNNTDCSTHGLVGGAY